MTHPLELPRTLRLTLADLDDARRLLRDEAESLPPGFLQPPEDETLVAFLDGRSGQAFGIKTGTRLEALGLLRLPERGAFAGRPAFPFVPAEDWPERAAFVESTVVRKDLRGRGYQRALLKTRGWVAEANGRRWLCAGVHLENRVSWSNLLHSGFLLVGLRAQPSPARFGLLRPLAGASLPLRPAIERRVALSDSKHHAEALAAGLVGVELSANDELLYRRPVDFAVAAQLTSSAA